MKERRRAELGLSLGVTEEVENVKEVEEVEHEVVRRRGEWSSLGLSLGAMEEVENVKEVEEVEDEVVRKERGVAELGFVLRVTEEVENVKEVEEVEDEVVSDGDEEWPSINAIPGLKVSEQKLQPEQAQPSSQTKPVADESSVSSSLGELRFQDE